MDELGKRLIRDHDEILRKRQRAGELQQEAAILLREAAEFERVSELGDIRWPATARIDDDAAKRFLADLAALADQQSAQPKESPDVDR